MPLKGDRVGSVDRKGGGTKGLVDRLGLEPDPLQGRPDQVADIAPLVLDPRDDLDLDRPAAERPDVVLQRRPGARHRRGDGLLGELGVVGEVRRPDGVKDGQFVVVERADVGVHRDGASLVDVVGDEIPVHQELHRDPDLADREGVEPTSRVRRRVEQQGDRRGGRVDQPDSRRARLQLLGSRRLEAEQVEVHGVVLDLQRRLVHVE